MIIYKGNKIYFLLIFKFPIFSKALLDACDGDMMN